MSSEGSWENINPSTKQRSTTSSSSTPTPTTPNASPPPTTEIPEDTVPNQSPPKRERHYGPRTCRICLETVEPSFDVNEGITSSFLGTKSRVKYVSDDPDSGRLMSPCKCKGSQRYVHEGCLQAWRRQSPLSDRNYWHCPTCQYQYRLERLRWGQWISNKLARGVLTGLVFFLTIFILGFFADPILDLWFDPVGMIKDTVVDVLGDTEAVEDFDFDGDGSWSFHLLKGLFSIGLLGCIKSLGWHLLRGGLMGGGTRRRGTGRDRMQDINYVVVVLGVVTFLGAVWKGISALSGRFLEKVSDRVVDVQGDEDDEEDDEDVPESRKDQ